MTVRPRLYTGLAPLVGAAALADVKATAHVIDATHANPKALWQTVRAAGGG